ncbi:hypothetical protein G3580_00660 [Nitrogeniibacter mangrovi]|uniref:Phasin domain-containing protein n=1 Tax=Nitrogeniibacter mangrovi TaxID=2016596 RepID=A0A6C1AYR1_9RHOO|nr:hypothetical protein [Nitrogeniibacter mangrovi]QID16263.1 hypothetical protein G3580_00660 [Nitrogeniibacter mangrovi]
MIAQALVREHHIDSLDHLHAYGQLGVDALERMTQLSLQHARDSFGTHATRAHSLLAGAQPAPMQVDTAVSMLQNALQVFTDSYEQWVALLEAQMDTAHRTAHATYEDLQRWTPAGLEIFVDAAELMSDAAEESTELAAEAGASMLKSLEQEAPKAPARRRTAVRKTA